MKKQLRRFVREWIQQREFLFVKGLSRRVGGWLDRYFTGNQITILRTLLCAPTAYFLYIDLIVLPTILISIILSGDFVDGALSRFQQGTRPPLTLKEEEALGLWGRINYRGTTYLGKMLDPLADKVILLTVLFAKGWGIVSLWLIMALTTVAVLLTLARPIMRWLKLGDGSSNQIGRIKIWVEIVPIARLVWFPGLFLVDTLFILALVFGLLSLSGHVLQGLSKFWKYRAMQRKARRKHKRRKPTEKFFAD